MSSLHKEIIKKSLPGLPHPPSEDRRKRGGGKKDYTPVSWSLYFDEERDVTINNNTFHVYYKGHEGPLVCLLHGGGHSGLSWAVFSKALSELITCQIIAIDIRGHGNTVTEDDSQLSVDVLVKDILSVYNEIFKDQVAPPTLLMGHSMGGAIAVHVAVSGLITSLIGLAVIDVVEGSAIESLSSMQSFLRGRPSTFPSLENAIEWSLKSGQLRNIDSARVSMPGQLKKVEEKISQASDDEKGAELTTPTYTWRINLTLTEPYWREWFTGLSKLMLTCTLPKLVILAGVDRLDKELTIGHMQGKLQVQVLSRCGHMVHEDVPDKVANIIATFLIRHKFAVGKESYNSGISSVPMC